MSRGAVVIGAGVSGLVSAIVLGKSGWRVTLVERAPRTAPLIRGFRRHGVYFDTGFHYTGGLGDGEVMDRLFRYLGVAGKVAPVPFEKDAFDRVLDLREGREFSFPVGLSALGARLEGSFPGHGPAARAYLAAVDEVFSAAPFVRPGGEPATPLVEESSNVSLAGFLARHTRDPWLTQVLSCHTLLHGVPPGEVPFRIHASVAGSYYRSVHGVAGGGERIAEELTRACRDLGVEVLCGAGAARIRVSPAGNLAGVEIAGGEAREADAVVATVHPSALAGMVPEGVFRPAFKNRLRSLEETTSAYILFAALPNAGVAPRAGNLLAFPQAGAGAFADREIGSCPFYVAPVAAPAEGPRRNGLIAIFPAPAALPPGWEGLPRGERPPGYAVHKAEMTERMRNEVEKVVPGFSSGASLECATPLTLRDFGGSPVGSLYGAKHRVGQHNPSARTRLPGLFLAGQSTLCPGVLGASLSALIACELLVGPEAVERGMEGRP